MRAIVQRIHGSPDILRLDDVAKPEPRDDEVLVRVRAVSERPCGRRTGSPDEDALPPKPASLGFEQAATTPQAFRRLEAGDVLGKAVITV